MNLLISNDDGIHATGLEALAEAMKALGRVWVVAPETEQSAASHSLTMHKPLRVMRHGEGRWAVSGTPADSVYLAVHHLLPDPPDLVLSGINRGSNLGTDVFYSGTVAAAMEGCFNGFPSIAFSLHIEPEDTTKHYETAAAVAKRVVEGVRATPLPPRVLLNVNIPNVPLGELRGVRAVALGERHYVKLVDLRTDPRGRHYYWIGGPHDQFEPDDDTDGPTIERGFATVTPFRPDLTYQPALEALRTWTDG